MDEPNQRCIMKWVTCHGKIIWKYIMIDYSFQLRKKSPHQLRENAAGGSDTQPLCKHQAPRLEYF